MRNGLIIIALMVLLFPACTGSPLTPPSLGALQEKMNLAEKREESSRFFRAKFGESAGVDPRAREIEQRLGF